MKTFSKRDARECKPIEQLLPYQKTWVRDGARWKFGLMARQVGKDFASAFEGIKDCVLAETEGRRIDWLIAAPSERQSLESLQKWKEWAEEFELSISDLEETRESGSESLLRAASICFPGGSRVIAVPGKPDTVRGFSANVLMTEFAFFENPDATWRALLPSVTNSINGVKKVRIITTPNGIGNKAHDIWVKNWSPHPALSRSTGEGGRRPGEGITIGGAPIAAGEAPTLPGPSDGRGKAHTACDNALPSDGRGIAIGGAPIAAGEAPTLPGPSDGRAMWACHLVDIHRAVRDGLKADPDEIRAALDDPEAWAQEFECQFLDVQATLLPYELIAGCESVEATSVVPGEFWQATPEFPLVMGIDFGRRQDLTVAWTLARVGDVLQTVEVLEMARTPTPEQVEQLRPRLRQARRVCVDYTGAGVGLGDFLAKEFGEYDAARHKFGKVELCHFSNALKVEIFSKLRMAFEKRNVRVPVNRTIREDLHSISRVATASGQITYRAPHHADGHADRCTALALGLRASEHGMSRPCMESVSWFERYKGWPL
jgi:phage FluMu gp28-like protein